MKLIFYMKMNIKLLYRLILLILVGMTKHAQITQITSLQNLCDISRKKREMNLKFSADSFLICVEFIIFNPSRPDPGQREKINLKFLFSHVFVVPQKVLWSLNKTFWGTTEVWKCENKNLKSIFILVHFWKCTGWEGLRINICEESSSKS